MTLLLDKNGAHKGGTRNTKRSRRYHARETGVFSSNFNLVRRTEINITNPADLITAGNIVEPLLQFPAKRAGSGLK